MKNLILIFVFTFFAHALFLKNAIAFEVKCFWQWGLTSVGVDATMNPDKKSKPVNGEGGYDIFNVTDFSMIKGRKKVKTRLRFGNLGDLNGELYTNGRLEFIISEGAYRGQAVAKYKCNKTSIDVINYYNKPDDVKEIGKTKIIKKTIKKDSFGYFNTQCDFKFFNAKLNITPDKCIMNIQSFGEPYFTRDEKEINIMECIKNSDIGKNQNSLNSFVKNEKSKFVEDDNTPKLYLTLLFDDSGNTSNGLLLESWTHKNKITLKNLKKSFNGYTKANDENGNKYKINVGRGNLLINTNVSEIYLMGDCGPVKTIVNKNTETIKLNNKNIISKNKTPLTNLQKAKSTCTDLGFTPKTEKHGDCVMKMIDR